MKKKSLIIAASAVAAAVLALIILGVLSDGTTNNVDTVVYYITDDGYSLEGVEKSISYSSEKQLPADITEILKGENGELIAPVPEKTSVNSIVYENEGRMTVDLTGDFLIDNSGRNILQTYALIKSISGIAPMLDVNEIRITVNGKPVNAADGSEIGYVRGEDIISADDEVSAKTECVLYYIDKASGSLRGEQREVIIARGKTPEESIVENLIKGPVSKELRKILASGTELISAETLEGICYVNFASFNKTAGSEEAVSSVAKSIFSLNDINKVIIMINGKTFKEVYKEGAL